MKWTPEKMARVYELKAGGMSFSEIGRELGEKRLAVLGAYHREQVRRGHVPTPREGLSPELRRNTTPKRVYTRKTPEPQVAAAGVGFLLPALPAPVPQKGPAVGLLDLTGCKWAVGTEPGLIGTHAFCNAPREGKSSYCKEHHAKAVDPVARPIPKSIGAYGLRFGKAAA